MKQKTLDKLTKNLQGTQCFELGQLKTSQMTWSILASLSLCTMFWCLYNYLETVDAFT